MLPSRPNPLFSRATDHDTLLKDGHTGSGSVCHDVSLTLPNFGVGTWHTRGVLVSHRLPEDATMSTHPKKACYLHDFFCMMLYCVILRAGSMIIDSIYPCIPTSMHVSHMISLSTKGVAGRACETHDAVRLARLHRGARQDQLSVPSVCSWLHPTTIENGGVSTQGLGTLIGFQKKAKKCVLDASSLGERPWFEDPQVWRPNAKGWWKYIWSSSSQLKFLM